MPNDLIGHNTISGKSAGKITMQSIEGHITFNIPFKNGAKDISNTIEVHEPDMSSADSDDRQGFIKISAPVSVLNNNGVVGALRPVEQFATKTRFSPGHLHNIVEFGDQQRDELIKKHLGYLSFLPLEEIIFSLKLSDKKTEGQLVENVEIILKFKTDKMVCAEHILAAHKFVHDAGGMDEKHYDEAMMTLIKDKEIKHATGNELLPRGIGLKLVDAGPDWAIKVKNDVPNGYTIANDGEPKTSTQVNAVDFRVGTYAAAMAFTLKGLDAQVRQVPLEDISRVGIDAANGDKFFVSKENAKIEDMSKAQQEAMTNSAETGQPSFVSRIGSQHSQQRNFP